jgi:hypothetical protein
VQLIHAVVDLTLVKLSSMQLVRQKPAHTELSKATTREKERPHLTLQYSRKNHEEKPSRPSNLHGGFASVCTKGKTKRKEYAR